jgi:hypothetical protein
VNLQQALDLIAGFPRRHEFNDIRKQIPIDWIIQALEATGAATVRRRRLPAEQVIWLVIGMALMRNRSIHDTVSKLDLALPSDKGPTVAPSAVAQARARVGAAPLEALFMLCALHWAKQSADAQRWHGLSVLGIDGSTLRVSDSPENRKYFGVTNGPRGEGAYPLVRVVTLMVLRSHLLVAARFGSHTISETEYAEDLWREVPDESVTAVDRGFLSALSLIRLNQSGKNRHWVTRAKKNLNLRRFKRLGRNDWMVEMNVSAAARKKDDSLPSTWVARAVRYHRKGFRPSLLLTSLVDAEAYPAEDLALLYHERWELELGFDEIKTELLDREETIRSRKPEMVKQEVWGVLLAYNLVRLEMERIANYAGVPPTRVSFVGAYRLICDEWLWCAIGTPGSIPQKLQRLREHLVGLILPPRRGERSYPRAVKIKMTGYPRRRRSSTRTPLK